jgi:hypothetical protein
MINNIEQDTHANIIDDIEDTILDPKKGIFDFLKSKNSIGKLNGYWASLFKLILILTIIGVPTMFSWMVWATSENFANKYNRERTIDIVRTLESLHEDITGYQRNVSNGLQNITLNTTRLQELEDRLNKLENEHQITQNKITGLDGKNTEEHTKVLVLLEAIKTKVDLMHKIQ